MLGFIVTGTAVGLTILVIPLLVVGLVALVDLAYRRLKLVASMAAAILVSLLLGAFIGRRMADIEWLDSPKVVLARASVLFLDCVRNNKSQSAEKVTACEHIAEAAYPSVVWPVRSTKEGGAR